MAVCTGSGLSCQENRLDQWQDLVNSTYGQTANVVLREGPFPGKLFSKPLGQMLCTHISSTPVQYQRGHRGSQTDCFFISLTLCNEAHVAQRDRHSTQRSVGHALIQVARVYGARPIGVVSHPDKVRHALDSGADEVIDTSSQDLLSVVLSLTDGRGAGWAFDVLGGPRVGQLLDAVSVRGTLVCIGFSSSAHGTLNVADLVISEKRVLGYDAHLETGAQVQNTLDTLMRLAASGEINPRIDSRFALTAFDEAYQRLSSRKACGPLLLPLS